MQTTSADQELATRLRMAIARSARRLRQEAGSDLSPSLSAAARAAATSNGTEETFEDWVSNRFGRRLFELFFRSYTEKVWGVPATEIRAEWAAQRIKGLSFLSAARAALLGDNGEDIKSLIRSFHYPRFYPINRV